MKSTIRLFTVFVLAPFAALHVAELASARELPLAFVKKHCLECHNVSTLEGGFRADLLGKELADSASQKSWSRVLVRVQSGEMPPPQDSERPAEAEVGAASPAIPVGLSRDEGKTRHVSRVLVPGVFR